ncbi:Transcription factor like [Actinidia chinensis var. chinensis]|uniref:Transcription factor like n=1 Tax=Actinidia chinensis var. chinensis TaxID=1590841 RepID=A0A2R6QQ55_ACTCC|nr:Transcription factor like [Actinidia chinensis var. chinensis]
MSAGFFPSKMITTENIVKKKPKVKIASKRIEANPEARSCVFLKTEIMNNKRVKSSALGTKKRGLEAVEECRKEKRRKMDRSATQQCYKVLRELMTHPAGRVFNQPVDPVKLHIPDYFSIISEPMDLGTIDTKLVNYPYSSVEEFATDVRLTFSNAMFYYPRHTDVHKMAKELDDLFDTRWRSLEAKWNRGQHNCGAEVYAKRECKEYTETQKFWNWGRTNVGQRRTSAEEMQKFREQILEVSRGKISQQLQGLLKKLGFNCVREEIIELDIDAFAEETLMELKGIIRSFIGARVAKTTNGVQQSERKMNHKRGADSGHRSISGSAANVNTPLNLVTSKCGSCGSIRCQCSLQRDYANSSSSGLCSERSLGQAHLDTSRKDYDGKSRSSSQMSKSDVASDGSARALAQERICSLNEPASGEDCPPLVDVQLSPKMALRAAKLRSRYAKIILKANTFLAHGDKADLVLLQKEKESLKRQQREEKFKTEATQIRAAEGASRTELKTQHEQERKAASCTELKKQREQERKAARLALEQMERTVEIDDNLVSLKDLNDMLRGRWSDTDPAVVLGPIGGIHVGNVLQRLGVSLKDDSILNGDIEEGERTS